MRGKLPPELRQRMVDLYREGNTPSKIAALLGKTRTTVGRVLAAEGERERSIDHEALTDEDRDWLASQYEAGYGLNHLAQQLGCSVATGREALVKRGIKIRRRGPAPLALAMTSAEHDEAVRLYHEGHSREMIGKIMGHGTRTVHNALARMGIPEDELFQRRDLRGEKRHNWAGGRRHNSSGYIGIWQDENPEFPEMCDKKGYVLEHRLVMARSLGRPLEDSETVHHINGDRTDNRLENLQLRQGRHGKHVHYVCLDCGSHNVVAAELA